MGRLEIGSTLGGYRILAPLGAGGMGEVYRALDTRLKREVALKVLPEKLSADPLALERFEREAQLLASVSHPNIATIHGIDHRDGVRFLVMELVEGRALDELLARGPLAVDEALRVAAEVARGLEAAHRRGVIHRDLKPGNVMVSAEGEVKILDFGLAKALDLPGEGGAASEEDPTEAALTAVGATLGTVPYMSPEQARGESVDSRCDVWAFGCLLFEALTGRRAFQGSSPVDTAVAILEREPAWETLPELPGSIRALLTRCLHKDPDRRVPAIADARVDIEEALGLATASRGGGIRVPGTPPSRLDYLDVVGDYAVVEKLGSGGHGEVYRAWDRSREREVALKVLRSGMVGDADARARLEREAAVLAGLDHPGIAALVEFGSRDGVDFLARELVDGEPLTTRLARGPLPDAETIPILRQTAAALEAAHRQGVVHRDLKPGNILLTREGAVKLVDFGLAARIDRGEGPEATSGPLPYCPPEVLSGGVADARSDLYTLGVVAYQMATGRRPFQSRTAEELTRAILEEPLRPPSELRSAVSPQLEQLILRWLSRDPARRGTLEEGLSALAALSAAPAAERPAAGRLDAPLPTPEPWAAAATRPRARRLLPVFVLTAVALAAGAALWLVSSPGEPVSRAGDLDGLGSLVVLPARILPPDGDAAFLTDALPALLTSHLSGVAGLDLKVPPASVDYAPVEGDLAKVGQMYGVEAALLPAVTVREDRLGLTLQLVRPADRSVLWSHVYEGRQEAVFELARTAARDVQGFLRPHGRPVATVAGLSPVSDSELALQRGLHYSAVYRNRLRQTDLDRALAALEEALALDPTNARAAAALAILQLSRMASGAPMLEVASDMKLWADRAIELDPGSSSAWAVLSALEPGREPDSYRRKLEYALKAADLGPRDGYAHTSLSVVLSANSNELALAAAREAARLEPLRQTGVLYEAVFLLTMGRVEQGLERLDFALENEPDQPFALMIRALALARAERHAEATEQAAALERFVAEGRLHPRWASFARDFTRFAEDGTRPDSAATLQRLLAVARGEAPFPRWENMTRGVVGLLARRGETEAAIELLRARHDKDIRDTLDYLLFTSDLEPIRGDERLAPVVDGAADRFDAMVEILADARERGEFPAYLDEPVADLLKRIRIARGGA